MKQVRLHCALMALIVAAPLGAAWAQNANNSPPPSKMPSAVSGRLGGATVTPVPGAKPIEGLVIPPPNPGEAAGQAPRREERRQ